MRRCVVPLFANTDSDSDDGAEMDVDGNEDDDQESSHSDISEDGEAELSEEAVDRRPGVRSAETLSDAEESNAKSKREKFDSGVGDLFESPSSEQSGASNQSVVTDSTGSSSPVESAENAADAGNVVSICSTCIVKDLPKVF